MALADELLETMGLLRRHTRHRIERPWPVRAVSGAQVELIRLVRRKPDISVAAAATELGVAPNTVSTLVGSLVGNGMVRRSADPHDRRVARLRLTDAARSGVEQWRDARSAAVAQALDRLADDDRTAIQHALPALLRLAAQLGPEDAA